MVDLSWCPTLADLYRDGGAKDQDGVQRQTGGLSTPNNLFIIRALMMKLKPERTIEVGMASGGSALTIAATHRDLGRAASYQHTAIDPYQDRSWSLGKTLIRRAGLDQFVRVLEDFSCIALPGLMRAAERFQFAYIDGSHTFDDVGNDFYYIHRMADIGGVILLDDATHPDVRRFISHTKRHTKSVRQFNLDEFRHQKRLLQPLAALAGREQCVAFQKIAEPETDEWRYRS